MRTFRVRRLEDETGVSGTGIVAEGVEFASGWCVMSWLTKFKSMELVHSMDELIRIHGHNGKTTVEYVHGLTTCEEEAARMRGLEK